MRQIGRFLLPIALVMASAGATANDSGGEIVWVSLPVIMSEVGRALPVGPDAEPLRVSVDGVEMRVRSEDRAALSRLAVHGSDIVVFPSGVVSMSTRCEASAECVGAAEVVKAVAGGLVQGGVR